MAASPLVDPAEDTDDTILQPDPAGRAVVDVLRETMAVNDWSQLAPLIGVLEADYERIVAQEKDLRKQQKAIIKQWLNNGKATWAILAASLRDPLVGNAAIGDEIAKKHPRSSSSSGGTNPGPAQSTGGTQNVTGSTPTLKELKSILIEKSSQWDGIGSGLGVPYDFRQGLRTNPMLDNAARLEAVLNKWMEIQSPVTWKKFKKELVNMELMDCAGKVDKYL